MKLTYFLHLLAFAIAPALSQPHNAAIDNTLAPTLASRADTVPFACTRANTIIESQLAEISQLQSNHLPIPPDLSGYFYSVVYGRRLLGCPSTPLLSPHSKRSGIIDDHPEVRGDPCKTLRVLYEEVIDPIHVLKNNNIPIPAFLAGLWSSVSDGEKMLSCGFSVSTITGGNSTASSGGSE